MTRLLGSFLVAAAVAWLAAPSAVLADCGRGCRAVRDCAGVTPDCGDCGPVSLAPTYVERTVMVPQWVTETKLVDVTQFNKEVRQRTVTKYKCVPETKQVTRTGIVMVPKTRTRTQTYCVRIPVTRTVTRRCQVQVPYWREVSEEYTVNVPVWKEVVQKCKVVGCKPEIRTRTVKVCEMQPQTRTRKRKILECRTEEREQTVKLTDYKIERRTREVNCMVMVPKRVTKTHNVRVYHRVAYEDTQDYIVCVPVTVQKEVRIRRCQMVPKTVKVRVACGGGGCGGCGRCGG